MVRKYKKKKKQGPKELRSAAIWHPIQNSMEFVYSIIWDEVPTMVEIAIF
jgi:hypothetical protein